MRKLMTILMLVFFATSQVLPQQASGQTYCNPLNISYRFGLNAPSFRVAADPNIVLYKDKYFLFATQSGGYWYSDDLLNWNFVTTPDLPFELDAPAAAIIGDSLYYIPMNSHIIYRAIDPIAGKWEKYNTSFPLAIGDPDFFVDTDNKVYLYYGCSNNDYIRGVELDVKNKLNPIGSTVNCFKGEPTKYGWERPGDYNTSDENPWIEGPWMTKYNGKYYLQHAAPATQSKGYGDGYYVSNSPLGPFTYAPNNPFSAKPEGFIAAAGHGSTFADKYGNWWHIASMSISVKHMFERRLGLFPVTFDAQGNMVAHTEFGDLPMIMPDHKYNDVSELFPGWMMLSYKKTGAASSSLATNPISNAFNEDIRTYWSAATGNKGEWLSVDLGVVDTVKAVQLNFAENNTQLFGRNGILAQQYLLQYSTDKITWKTLADKTTNTEDLTHQYHVMATPVLARYLRVTNYRVPGGTFAVSGFRVFGSAVGSKPTKVTTFQYTRDQYDSRDIYLKWNKQKNATGYMIRFGVVKDKLYRSYQVYSDTTLTIRSLNKDLRYWFAIDAFGETGITCGDVQEGVITSACPTTPYISVNNEALQQLSSVTLNSGKALTLSPQPSDGTWNWTGPYGFTATTREISFNSIDASMAGTYLATYTNTSGCKSAIPFTVTVNGFNGCTETPIIPYLQVNSEGWQQTNKVSVNAGGTVKIGPQALGTGTWRWTGPNGFSSTAREITITNIQAAQAGQYKAIYTTSSCAGVMFFTISLGKPSTGVDDINSQSVIEQYPNPVKNQIVVKNILPVNTAITVYNLDGQAELKTTTKEALGEAIVDLTNLKAGAYCMRVGNYKTVKFIKL